MEYKNKIIDIIEFDKIINRENEKIFISNCVINKINFCGIIFSFQIEINNSIINNFDAIGTFFEKGLILKNSIFMEKFTLEAGGHNANDFPILIENNIFICYVDFFDSIFFGPFYFINNIVLEGSNLLGNINNETKVKFNEKTIDSNLGNLKMDD